jgi:hypothetical protein
MVIFSEENLYVHLPTYTAYVEVGETPNIITNIVVLRLPYPHIILLLSHHTTGMTPPNHM